jgi:glycosyltransferase involved in cell wall biosynthesis
MSAHETEVELTVLMPCLNEAETLEVCIHKAMDCLRRIGVSGEVLIADNGSTDGSQQLAAAAGARVVDVPVRGYGGALMGGIQAARGRYIVMGDADDSYDFSRLDLYLERLRAGAELVMGNRFKGGIAEGAMPPLHRYLGNPVLSFIGRLFFRSGIGDFHCGLRGFNRQSILDLDLRTTGMEFASEMVVKATLNKLRIEEVPTTLKKDGRSRPPHLRTWRDGWRHLRFLLMYSPRWLFVLPGIFMFLLGLAGMLALLPGPLKLGSVSLDVHTMLYCSALILIGLQALVFGVLTKVFAITNGFLPPDPRMDRMFKVVTLETGLITGIATILLGLGLSVAALRGWGAAGFGGLNPTVTLRNVIPAVTAMAAGFQIVMASFFLSILGMQRR